MTIDELARLALEDTPTNCNTWRMYLNQLLSVHFGKDYKIKVEGCLDWFEEHGFIKGLAETVYCVVKSDEAVNVREKYTELIGGEQW